jgi:hypothetical protein
VVVRRMRLRASLHDTIAVLSASLLVVGVANDAHATSLWGANGAVTAVARLGNTLFIGGAFSSVGPCTGGGVPVDRRTGRPLGTYPRVAGTVLAVVADGAGGWYVGGQFIGVGGLPRTNLAHILADGSVAPWAPEPNDVVTGLLVREQTVFVWGSFTAINGQSRWFLAAVDGASGRVTDWDPHPNSVVFAAALRGGALFVGGNFDMIGGKPRTRLAALDVNSGAANAWNPSADYTVTALAVRGNRVYVGGVFLTVGGQHRLRLAALDAVSGQVLAWNPGADRPIDPYFNPLIVSSLVVAGERVYVGGSFQTIAGQARTGLAALDATSGAALPWNPHITEPFLPFPAVKSMSGSGGRLYVTGMFDDIDGHPRLGLAALDATTGAVEAWDPRPNDPASCVAAGDGVVYVGGGFTSIGPEWQERNSLAALDATSGALLDWNPGGRIFLIHALTVAGNTVYVGGDFSSIGGRPRSSIAALDARTGQATSWNPQADGPVWALAVRGTSLFAGGPFGWIGGQSRSHLGALDLDTGAATAWNPSPNDAVTCLAGTDSVIYVGG